MRIRRAALADLPQLLQFRADAARWLTGLGIEQWSNPFPPDVIAASVTAGDVYVVQAGDGSAAATVTLDRNPGPPSLWTDEEREQPAMYVHKMAVDRRWAGQDLGGRILDWCGDVAARAGALWLRLDAWTTNRDLQRWYLDHGFQHVRTATEPGIVSGWVAQRPAQMVDCNALVRFQDRAIVRRRDHGPEHLMSELRTTNEYGSPLGLAAPVPLHRAAAELDSLVRADTDADVVLSRGQAVAAARLIHELAARVPDGDYGTAAARIAAEIEEAASEATEAATLRFAAYATQTDQERRRYQQALSGPEARLIVRVARDASDVDSILRWQRPPHAGAISSTALADLILAEVDGDAVATIEIDKWADPELWTDDERHHDALYVHRIAIRRSAATLQVGSALLDWASRHAASLGHQWIRLEARHVYGETLHQYYADGYYIDRGWDRIRTMPSRRKGSLFQREAGSTSGTGPAVRDLTVGT